MGSRCRPRRDRPLCPSPEALTPARNVFREPDDDHLAARPKAGVLIEGTGGVRKLRWARDGRGKSGGVRVIYYFHSEAMPLYLLTMLEVAPQICTAR